VESTWSGESSFGGDETGGLEGEPRRPFFFFLHSTIAERDSKEHENQKKMKKKKNVVKRENHILDKKKKKMGETDDDGGTSKYQKNEIKKIKMKKNEMIKIGQGSEAVVYLCYEARIRKKRAPTPTALRAGVVRLMAPSPPTFFTSVRV
jgi:hypothetical protein